jgi:hypothetical protein
MPDTTQTKIEIAMSTALDVASFVEKLTSGVVDGSDPRLSEENIFERKTYVTRNVSHLKRLMSQPWFTSALDIDNFTKINDAIVAGEDYLG